jgi:hypothetical protein
MVSDAASTDVRRFVDFLAELHDDERMPPERRHEAIKSNTVLAVGALIGAGFPHAGACICLLLETQYPAVHDWPWREPHDRQGTAKTDPDA